MSALNRSTGVKQVPSTDALRNFYFSGATNYTAFKHKAEKSDLNSSVTSQNQSELPSPAADRTSTQAGSPPTPSVAAGSAHEARQVHHRGGLRFHRWASEQRRTERGVCFA
jgi:hypothetical protein